MKYDIEKIAFIFKALSHPTRLAIVIGLLNSDGCNVTAMVKNLGLLQPNISQHLTILKNAQIIKGYRKKSQICYKITNKDVEKIIKKLEINQ